MQESSEDKLCRQQSQYSLAAIYLGPFHILVLLLHLVYLLWLGFPNHVSNKYLTALRSPSLECFKLQTQMSLRSLNFGNDFLTTLVDFKMLCK